MFERRAHDAPTSCMTRCSPTRAATVSKPVQDRATSFTAAGRQGAYTFTLRKGATFANGDPVTASGTWCTSDPDQENQGTRRS